LPFWRSALLFFLILCTCPSCSEQAEGAEERKEQWRLLEAFVLAGRLARAVVALQEAEQHAALVMIEKVIEGAKEAEVPPHTPYSATALVVLFGSF
jgi:Tfp pilus assembly protein PilF